MRRPLLLALGIAAALLGAYLFYRVLQRYDFQDVLTSLRSVPAHRLGLAGALTIASFLCIGGMEYLAVRYAERDTRTVSPARIARTAVAAIGIGHSFGLAALSSGAIRYRMYGRAGLALPAIGEIVVFSGLSVTLGLGLVGGLALLWQGHMLAEQLDLPLAAVRAVGIGGCALGVLYLALCVFSPRHSFKLGSYQLRLPSWRVAIAQISFSSLNYACVAGALYAALATFTEAPYGQVAGLYVGSELSALIAHVPGGWGLLEYVFVQTLSGHGVVGGLLVFRAIYYLLPLFIGLAVWLLDEIAGRRQARSEGDGMKAQNA